MKSKNAKNSRKAMPTPNAALQEKLGDSPNADNDAFYAWLVDLQLNQIINKQTKG